VAERLLDRHYTFVARPAPKGDLARWLFARVRDVLSTAVTDQPTLGAPATEVERSQFHLTPAFHASMEMPPHRSLIELQIRSTRQLMANSNLSVTEISAQVGYDDSGYFARLFRRHIGTTPAAYWRERRS
jgi:AraC-like DNA-binding protein